MITTEEYQRVCEANRVLEEQLAQALHQIAELTERLAVVEAKKPPPPAFVKRNTPVASQVSRKKRAPEQNQARQRETPTEVVDHPITACPVCQGHLGGDHVGRRRQVIDLPPPPPVQITEHQVHRGWCSYCHAWREAPVDLHAQVVGQGRLGVRLAAQLVTMRQELRLPFRLIQDWLRTQHGLRVSVGALSDLLHRLAAQVRPVAEQIRDRIRGRPAVFADETSWREAGQNGYIWAMGTPEGERYYERHASRAGSVINAMVGEAFTGVLTTDFYAGYNDTPGGRHQRCWVHLLRDLHALQAEHAEHAEVLAWATALRAVYTQACAARTAEVAARQQARTAGEAALWALGQQYAGDKGHPCAQLAKRLLRHHGELLVFLTAPGVTPDNNAAERSVRPLVVARKISGGSRSARGSATHMTLASVVQTCRATSREVFATLLRLFQSPLPQL